MARHGLYTRTQARHEPFTRKTTVRNMSPLASSVQEYMYQFSWLNSRKPTEKSRHGRLCVDRTNQRPYRKDRFPRAYFCCRQLAKCRIALVHWLVCYKPAGQSFPDFGVWVSVDFDSKYKIVWGETRDHKIPILEEIKKWKKKNLHNYSNISTPPYYQNDTIWGGGGSSHWNS